MEQFLPDNYCLTCRGCCRFPEEISCWSPYLTDQEIIDLPEHARRSGCLTAVKSIRLVPDGEKFRCVFLDPQTHACAIYPSRPFECRLYPLVLARREEKIFLAIDPYCPYVKKQLGTEKMNAYIERLLSFLSAPRQKSVILNNPHLIHPYEEVVYLKELYGGLGS